MQKVNWLQWFVRLIRHDMNNYHPNSGIKQEVYEAVKNSCQETKQEKRES